MADKPHPGITMHKLSFGGGFVGLVFAAGSALIFALGFPTLWYFIALAFALGVGIAVFLRAASTRISQHNKPLSLFAAPEQNKGQARKHRIRWHSMPRLSTT